MATISFSDWSFGLDLRKGPSTADANRLRVLRNAYVTEGKTVRKRQGCVKVDTLQPGTVGLSAGLGKLNTFQILNGSALIDHGSDLIQNHELSYDGDAGASPGQPLLISIEACEPFNGRLYVVASQYAFEASGQAPLSTYLIYGFLPITVSGPVPGSLIPKYLHHYLDGGPSTIVAAAPQSRAIIKAASKIWAADGDVVRYCKTNDPRDWTAANDAGFLPVGLQQSGAKDATALGHYQNKLVAFFEDSAQIWQVDPDPTNNQFLQSVDIGTRYAYAHSNMAGDVFYMSPAGVRTITRQSQSETLVDADVGSAIARELLKGEFIDLVNPRAKYFRAAGQYWLYSGQKAVVFTFSRTAKISAWSVYDFPFTLDYVEELNTELYIRSGDDVYKMDAQTWADDGVQYEVEVETAFVDFKMPGVLKQIQAMDAVTTGSGDFSHRYDPRSPALETSPPVTISGDTGPGNLYPVELMTTNLSTVVRNHDASEFELHSIRYLYRNLVSL